MVKYREKLLIARAKGEPNPQASDYIGLCIMTIANKLSKKSNFAGYSQHWREEMIADGYENVIKYSLHNFDPAKSKNPFAYFTQCIKNAFKRRINMEKEQQAIKMKSLQQYIVYDSEVNLLPELMSNEFSDNIIEAYEASLAAKRKKKEQAKAPLGLEVFAGDTDED
jgi:hypothetical protein